MTIKNSNPFQVVVKRIAGSSPGAWFFARTLHHLDAISLRLSAGRMNMTSLFTGIPLVIVTTTGAKTGLPRTVPLVCIHDECNPGSFALIASNWGQEHYPAWYFNLKANPCATCSIGTQTRQYFAHEATGEEYARFWQCAADAYIGYPLYRQRIHGRNIPIMVMTPLQ